MDKRMISSTKQQPQQRLRNFSPKGLKVLLVDDNPLSLAVMETMLLQCEYNVTICTRASQAISLLTENGGVAFDIVMSDVCLPEESCCELLETAVLRLGMPVILMSAKAETSVVMRGITNGACDYLIKPIQMEQLRNIWQHVFRRRHPRQQSNYNYQRDDYSLGEKSSDARKTLDSSQSSSKKRKDKSAFSGVSYFKKRKERAEAEQQDTGQVIKEIDGFKKTRVDWTVQLHHQFVKAVNHLQIDKAVPKKILEIMKVQGLTRRNVSSHLQKYRLHLKSLTEIIPEPHWVASFNTGGDDNASRSIQMAQKQDDEHRCLSTTCALNSVNLGGARKAVSSGRGAANGGTDGVTLISLQQQYLGYEQRRAIENEGQLDSKGGLGMDNSWSTDSTAATAQRIKEVKNEDVLFDTAGNTSVNAKEEKDAKKFSLWSHSENIFMDNFTHECEFPILTAGVIAQADADILDYLSQSK